MVVGKEKGNSAMHLRDSLGFWGWGPLGARALEAGSLAVPCLRPLPPVIFVICKKKEKMLVLAICCQ